MKLQDRMNEPEFRYYLITDRRQSTRRTLVEAVEEACRQGIKAVQLREKDLPGRELYELADELRTITSRRGAKLFINDRADVALAVGADGVHCPESGLSPGNVRGLNANLLIGASVHSPEAARQAADSGADFLLFGPVYRTPSKIKYGDPQGIAQLKAVVEAVSVPVYAVGGIAPERAGPCMEAGAHGVAGISSILQANSIEQRVNEWRQVLNGL